MVQLRLLKLFRRWPSIEIKDMNIKDILSKDEQVLFKAQQKGLVPGGKEETPGEIFVTTKTSSHVRNYKPDGKIFQR
jgi:hypothetical protein